MDLKHPQNTIVRYSHGAYYMDDLPKMLVAGSPTQSRLVNDSCSLAAPFRLFQALLPPRIGA